MNNSRTWQDELENIWCYMTKEQEPERKPSELFGDVDPKYFDEIEAELLDRNDDYVCPDPIRSYKAVLKLTESTLECLNEKCRCKERLNINEGLERK